MSILTDEISLFLVVLKILYQFVLFYSDSLFLYQFLCISLYIVLPFLVEVYTGNARISPDDRSNTQLIAQT